MKFNIGSRGSALALAQTHSIARALEMAHPQDEFHVVIIKTKGDKDLLTPLHEMQDKGLFVQELEHALLEGSIDLAVHSMKDMPSEESEELCFPIVPRREDPRDVIVWREPGFKTENLFHAKIGTGSKRRVAQLNKLFPGISTVGIRGNIETRMKKIETEGLDGIMLAAAGLLRGGHAEKISYAFPTEVLIPSPCQGILALQTKKVHHAIIQRLQFLHHEDSHRQSLAERSFLKEIGAGCHAPVGAYCEIHQNNFFLRGIFGDEEGHCLQQKGIQGILGEESAAGAHLAKELKKAVMNRE